MFSSIKVDMQHGNPLLHRSAQNNLLLDIQQNQKFAKCYNGDLPKTTLHPSTHVFKTVSCESTKIKRNDDMAKHKLGASTHVYLVIVVINSLTSLLIRDALEVLQ